MQESPPHSQECAAAATNLAAAADDDDNGDDDDDDDDEVGDDDDRDFIDDGDEEEAKSAKETGNPGRKGRAGVLRKRVLVRPDEDALDHEPQEAVDASDSESSSPRVLRRPRRLRRGFDLELTNLAAKDNAGEGDDGNSNDDDDIILSRSVLE